MSHRHDVRRLLTATLAGLTCFAGCSAPSVTQVEEPVTPNRSWFSILSTDTQETVDRLNDIRRAREAILQNLAHAHTPGYHAIRPVFYVVDDESPSLVLRRDATPASMALTGRELDIAIEGEGFFQAWTEEKGSFYTRAGALYVNREGHLVLGSRTGPRLQPGITLPEDAVTIDISQQGEVRTTQPGGIRSSHGHIALVTFIGADSLAEIAPGRYVETEDSGPPFVGILGQGTHGTILQGYLEESNVNLYLEAAELQELRDWEDALAESIGLDPDVLEQPGPIQAPEDNDTVSRLGR
ncbi:MAG: flagellar hook basal-body protein [Planctomycetota bacterium]